MINNINENILRGIELFVVSNLTIVFAIIV